MKLLTAALLLLFLALYLASTEGSKCKCSRKGPKIRYSDVQKVEMKPKYPFCEEKVIIVTTISRSRSAQYCLHPKLQATKRLLKWFKMWRDKGRVYEE